MYREQQKIQRNRRRPRRKKRRSSRGFLLFFCLMAAVLLALPFQHRPATGEMLPTIPDIQREVHPPQLSSTSSDSHVPETPDTTGARQISSSGQSRPGQQSRPTPDTTTPSQGTTQTAPAGWQLLLVSAKSPLPEGYEPELAHVENGYYVDARIVEPLRAMLRDARDQGLSPLICSAYRSPQRQQALFEQQVTWQQGTGLAYDEAVAAAATVVAFPGASEHNTGLAVDIVAESYQHLEEDQEQTAESIWLHQNCHRYGFILRYPKGKEDTTGIIYEPWHFRYVGVEAATAIAEEDLTLETYRTQ